MNVTELLNFAYGNVHAADLRVGDVILRDAIGGQVHVVVTEKYAVKAGSAVGRLAVNFRYANGHHGYFHPLHTDTVMRAYFRPPLDKETN